MTKTVEIFRKDSEKFTKKIFTLNKKLIRFGNSPIKILSNIQSDTTFNLPNKDELLIPTRLITLEIPENSKRENVTFLGTYSITSGVPMIFNNNKDISLNSLFESSGKCDLCNVTRERKRWFFFEENGKVKQFGSSCAQEYFGLPLEEIISFFEKNDIEYSNETDFGVDSWVDESFFKTYIPRIKLSTLITYLNHLTNGFTGFWEKGPEGTSAKFKELFLDKNVKIINLDEDYLKTLEIKIKKFWKKPNKIKNDFEFNIFSNFYIGDEFQNYYSFSNAGIVLWAIWKALFKKEEKIEEEFKTPDVHVGEIGQRIEIEGKIQYLGFVDNSFGGSDINAIYSDKGLFKWFSSVSLSDVLASFDYKVKKNKYDYNKWADMVLDKKAISVKLVGTIKQHNVYRGKKETVLSRCRIIDIV